MDTFQVFQIVFFFQAEEAKHAAETKYEMCCDNARREVYFIFLIYYISLISV